MDKQSPSGTPLPLSLENVGPYMVRLCDFYNAGKLHGPAAYHLNGVMTFLRSCGVHCRLEITLFRGFDVISAIIVEEKRFPVTSGTDYVEALGPAKPLGQPYTVDGYEVPF